MSIELETGGIKIVIEDVNDLITMMSGEEKINLIEVLSCHDEVIKHVVDQIGSYYGQTENGYSGWESSNPLSPSTPLSKARIAIAKGASDQAECHINRLERHCKYLEERNEHLADELYKIKA